MKIQKNIGVISRFTYGFTLIELLFISAMILVLASLLLTSLGKAKGKTDTILCRNNLKQTGIQLLIYLDEYHHYPPLWDGMVNQGLWCDLIENNNKHSWTNRARNCPSYIREKGLLSTGNYTKTSYSYNWMGTVWRPKNDAQMKLGLGWRPQDASPEVWVPSQMYAVADVRPMVTYPHGNKAIFGDPKMTIYRYTTPSEGPIPHEQGYNILFCDGHTETVNRKEYLSLPRSAHHWNRDNQPHPESWGGKDSWTVTE